MLGQGPGVLTTLHVNATCFTDLDPGARTPHTDVMPRPAARAQGLQVSDQSRSVPGQSPAPVVCAPEATRQHQHAE
jgi:hypothetical protein